MKKGTLTSDGGCVQLRTWATTPTARPMGKQHTAHKSVQTRIAHTYGTCAPVVSPPVDPAPANVEMTGRPYALGPIGVDVDCVARVSDQYRFAPTPGAVAQVICTPATLTVHEVAW